VSEGGELDATELQRLIRQSVGGDAEAAQALIERFYPRTQQIVHRQLEQDFRRRHRWILPLFSTRDVVHDVFAEVVAGLDESADFPSEAAFVAYLTTMVRNRLLDAVRYHEAGKRDARRHVPDPSQLLEHAGQAGEEAPALAAQLAEQAAVLDEVLGEFNERHKALLTLRIVDNETYPVIAEKLGYASAETARQSFLDAQAKLLVKLRARGLR
jgi:RNA polymerase sigma factor (sigma-70 family)